MVHGMISAAAGSSILLLSLCVPASHSLSLGASRPGTASFIGGDNPFVLSHFVANEDATTVPAAAAAALSGTDIDGTSLLYASDLFPRQQLDVETYAQCSQMRHRDCLKLFDRYATETLRCETLDGATINIRWRASWVPPGSSWLYDLADLAGWDIDRRDPDPSKVATFSWRSVGKVFGDAFRTGTIRLPVSAVEGSTLLKFFDSHSEEDLVEERCCVVSIKESVDLIREADAGRLLNRRVAQELASWLDVSRRPPNGLEFDDEDEWAGLVRERVLSRVPGAGSLDVDPNEDEAEGIAALFVFGAVCAAALALSYNVLVEEVVGGTGSVSAQCDDAARVEFGSGYLSECFGPFGDGPFVK